jgi:arylsulfatase A-like enzyme
MSRPNVLFVVLDTVRRDHLSCYRYDRRTSPNLERLAGDATTYEHAVSAAPWTLPSHASMFTGRYPSHHRTVSTRPHLEADQPTVAEELSAMGYTTLGFANTSFISTDRGFARGFDSYHDLQRLPHLRGRYYELSREFLQLVLNYLVRGYDTAYFQAEKLKTALRRTDSPWFAFVNFLSAHSPYDPPPAFKERFERGFDAWDAVDPERVRGLSADAYGYMLGDIAVSDFEWDLLKRWYDGEIAYVDYLLGSLMAFLKKRGLYEDTLVIVTADHGEQFGENGLAYHNFSLSEVVLNVPLLVKWPGNPESEVSTELISLVDLAPTILDVADVSRPETMQGRSLRSEPEPAAVFAEYAYPYPLLSGGIIRKYGDRFGQYERALQTVRTKTHKLVRSSKGDTTLYELIDGGEQETEDEELKRNLERRLDATLETLPEADVEGDEDLSEHTREHLRELGYLA